MHVKLNGYDELNGVIDWDGWEYCELLVDFTIAGFLDVRNTEETLPKFSLARV